MRCYLIALTALLAVSFTDSVTPYYDDQKEQVNLQRDAYLSSSWHPSYSSALYMPASRGYSPIAQSPYYHPLFNHFRRRRRRRRGATVSDSDCSMGSISPGDTVTITTVAGYYIQPYNPIPYAGIYNHYGLAFKSLAADSTKHFTIIDVGDGWVQLKSYDNFYPSRFCCTEKPHNKEYFQMSPTSDDHHTHLKFCVIDQVASTYTIQAYNDPGYPSIFWTNVNHVDSTTNFISVSEDDATDRYIVKRVK